MELKNINNTKLVYVYNLRPVAIATELGTIARLVVSCKVLSDKLACNIRITHNWAYMTGVMKIKEDERGISNQDLTKIKYKQNRTSLLLLMDLDESLL